MTDKVTVKLEKTNCCFCGSEFVTAEQHDASFTRYKHDSWVGLTDEDISEIVRGTHNTVSFVRAIEAKLKEKNT